MLKRASSPTRPCAVSAHATRGLFCPAFAIGKFVGTPPGGVLLDRAGSRVVPLIGGYLANRFDPSTPFLAYAPLLAVVGKETLER
jgi:hypothetical protein